MKADRPPRFPLAGHLPAFLKDKLGFLTRCGRDYGKVVPLWIGEPTFLLTDPEDIRHVLVSNAANYDKSRRLTSARGKRLSGSGMQTSFGAAHLKRRRLLQPSFQQRSIERFFATVVQRTRQMMDRWAGGVECDLASQMESLALSNILAAVFGEDLESERELAAAVTVRRRYIEYVYGTLLPYPEYLPHPVVLRYRGAQRTIEAAIGDAISKARADNAEPSTFAALFARARYPEGGGMSDAQVHDEILTLLSTGYETIGDALAWTLYLLAQHPEAASEIRSELRAVVGEGEPTLEHLPRLEYTRQVLDESMRLYPPTWIVVRMAKGGDVLPGGYAIPEGSKIYLCPWVMHRHPRWFPDPERFDPQRFSKAAKDARPRFAYFPFGGGPRTCIGEPFAILEAMTVLAMVATRFRFSLRQHPEVVLRPAITLRTVHGIPVSIERY